MLQHEQAEVLPPAYDEVVGTLGVPFVEVDDLDDKPLQVKLQRHATAHPFSISYSDTLNARWQSGGYQHVHVDCRTCVLLPGPP